MSATSTGEGVINTKAVKIGAPYYIHPPTAEKDDRVRVLSHNDTFAVFDRYGDIQYTGVSEQGLYNQGTRFLSRLILYLGEHRPLLLSSAVRQDNVLLSVDLANPDVETPAGDVVLPRGTLHFYRTSFLWNGAFYQRLRIRNYGLSPVEVAFSLEFESDFVDVFEIRGENRKKRGEMLPPVIQQAEVINAYRGLDNVVRRTYIRSDRVPLSIAANSMHYDVLLEAQEETDMYLTVACALDDQEPRISGYEHALAQASRHLCGATANECRVFTSNEQLNDWVNRSAADLHMMICDTPTGPYPYAGVPWFSVPFGRDGLITALEYLWVEPSIARGVLAYLAATQATAVIPEKDAEPGKILHEAREGEMAGLGEVPFKRYYGSVDSTPLFVLLAAEYYRRTSDAAFLRSIWSNIEAALDWIDHYGDADHDGFVEYSKKSPKGLVQQGWKDSHDSVFYADGKLAEGPIALCEVQAYIYAAKLGIADVAAALGREDLAGTLRNAARRLQEQFERDFWMEELSTYALALDGHKQQCKVRASNAGHCLFAGIASHEHAVRTAGTLLANDSFSGWGIRTLCGSEVRFNPMSYHNGSVWPHDNALIASGFGRYGLKSEAAKVLTGLFDSSLFFDLHRLPELFCGFARRLGKGPTLYPVACSPQSWSAGAVFLILEACLGISIDARLPRVSFTHPFLPPSLRRVEIRNLKVGGATVDFSVERYAEVVGIDILRRDGTLEVLTVN